MPPSAILNEPQESNGTSKTEKSILLTTQTPEVSRKPVSHYEEDADALPRTIYPPMILEDHPVDEALSIKAIVVGAGITGINAGILLPTKVPGLELKIYERHSDIGGVWNTNVYPGVKCDVPSHVYQSTFSPNKQWTDNYSRGAEIKSYWKGLADKYNVWQYLTLNSEVVQAAFSNETAKWTVTIRLTNPDTGTSTTVTDTADFLVLSTGRFSNPTLPSIPGLTTTFKGQVIHTGRWDPTFDPTGKKLALIGNGASGLQILPELQKVAAHVDHYARNPTWVAGTLAGEKLSRVVPIAPELKAQWKEDSESYHAYRKDLETQAWTRFAMIERGSERNNAAREEFTTLMGLRLGEKKKDELLPLVLPDFAPNCRRLTPGPGYLEALAQENVSYIRTPIESVTESGIRTSDGTDRPVDVIICATGADVTNSPGFPVINGAGLNLQTAWRAGGDPGFPDTYLGMAAATHANLLFLLGPNSGSGFAGTVPHTVETQVTYIAKILRKASRQRIRTIVPSAAAVRDFRAYCESFFPTTVMAGGCSSWYNNQVKGGRIVAVWPGSGAHVSYIRREVRWEDFEYTYHNAQGNRFGYFGNGWARRDVAAKVKGGDKAGQEEDFTAYLRAEAAAGEDVDLRGYHERWWEV
ncbi:hypothetical protein BJY01DRAFT_257842 [Aspergillus pseudoustus]|uniref:FAD/NAD(P)-binding domain-containing protein n=1 Tax=Aspergillus pseudoustus TaxID=1810923 RepID=A0ABR4JGF0_9EURO